MMTKLVLVMNCIPHKLDNLEFYIQGSILNVEKSDEDGYWKIVEDCKYNGRLLKRENCLILHKDYLTESIAEFRIFHNAGNVMKNVILNLIAKKESFTMQKAAVIASLVAEGSGIVDAIRDYNENMKEE